MNVDDRAFEQLAKAQARREAAMESTDVDAWILAARDCGLGHFELDQRRLANALFNEAIGLIEEHGIRREELPNLIGMKGRILQRRKRWSEALAQYRRAAESAAELGLAEPQLRWMGKEASTLIDMDDREAGLPRLGAAVSFGRDHLEQGGDPVALELSRLLGKLAFCVEGANQERAGELWKEAWSCLDGIPPTGLHALAATNYGMFLLRTDRKRQHVAITYLEEGIEIARKCAESPRRILEATTFLAAALRDIGQADRAGDLLMAEAPRIDDPKTRHEVLSEAVDHYFAGRSWEKMKAACGPLRELRERWGTPHGLYDLEMRYSIACRGLEELAESLSALARARKHAEASANPDALRDARGQTALVLVDKGDFAEAAQLAKELWNEGTRNRLLARTLVEALCATGDVDAAEAVRDELARAGGGETDVAWLTAILASHGRGDPLKAWYAYGASGNRNTFIEGEALSRLFELHPAASEDRFEVSRARLRLIDKVRTDVADVFSEPSWLAVTEQAKKFPAYLDAFLDTAVALRRHEDAIYDLERFRSQMLVDVLSERAACWSAGEQNRMWEKSSATNEYHRARYRLEGLWALGARWPARREAAQDVERKESFAWRAGGMMHLSPGFTGLHFPPNLEAHLADAALAEDEVLVFLHVGLERTFAWSVDGGGKIDHTILPALSHDALRARHAGVWNAATRGRRPLRHLGAAAAPDLSEQLGELDRVLAEPIVAWLSQKAARRVFWVAGTGAASLPVDQCAAARGADLEFCFLPTGRALGFARAVRYPLPDLLFIVEERRRIEHAAHVMQEARGKVQIVIDPTRTLEAAPLEAAMVARAAQEADVRILDAEVVDEEKVRQAACGVDILHLLGHGTFEDVSPYRSGMYLDQGHGTDALWTAAEIFTGVEAPAGRLAVLAGCETGRTCPNLASEEVSLPAAFLCAGYAAVIGSRWAVHDLSTALFMGDFYARWLAGGVSAARALRQSADRLRVMDRQAAAQRIRDLGSFPLPGRAEGWRDRCEAAAATVENGPAERPFADPAHWAAFFVAGDGAITADGPDSRVPALPELEPI